MQSNLQIIQLQKIFHSITKSLEVLYVVEGTKPCARLLVFEDELNKVIDFLKYNKIHTAISDFKVVKIYTQSDYYSDKSLKISKDDPKKGHYLVYLSQNKEVAEKAKMMEHEGMHKELGLILGYPLCCCNFFSNKFKEKSLDKNLDDMDLTLEILKNSDGYEFRFYNNICARHFDVTLLSHFPHSFNCKPSSEIAESNLKTLMNKSKEINKSKESSGLAELFTKILQSVVVYTPDQGIILLKKYQFEKISNEITYEDVLTTKKSKLYFLISSNNKLKIINKNHILMDNFDVKATKDDQFGIMVFGLNQKI